MVAHELREPEPTVSAHSSPAKAKCTATSQPMVFEHTAPPFFAEDSRVPAWLQNVIMYLCMFAAVHYSFWGIPILALLYWVNQQGYGLFAAAVLALYLPTFLDGSQKRATGRAWDAIRTSSMWNFSAQYLGLKVIREQELDSSRKYIFGCHPHGIIVLSRLTAYGGNWERVFPNIITRVLCASTMFYVPFGRDFCLWLGCVDASRSTAEKVLDAGHSVYVYPGGVPEIFLTNPYSKKNEILLSHRLGFIRLAIRNGADLVPTFVFGEKWLHNRWNPPKSVIAFFQRTLRIPLIIFWGKFLWMPKQPPKGKQFGIVYGAPIRVTQSAEPDEQQVRAIHTQYVAEVERLFYQYKGQFGYDADESLVIH